MSLLSIVNAFRLRKNMGTVATVFGNTADSGVAQMQALLQDVGDEVAESDFWQPLDVPASIGPGDGVTTIWPFPIGAADTPASDFAGMSPGLQMQSTAFPLQPIVRVTDEELAALKAFPVGPIRPVWHIIGNTFEVWPALSLGETLTYNYYSPRWIQTAAGVHRLYWSADTDISLIDEKVMTRGLEYRWLEAKGLSYGAAKERFERSFMRADGRQDTYREVNMSQVPLGGPSVWPGILPIYTTLTGDE